MIRNIYYVRFYNFLFYIFNLNESFFVSTRHKDLYTTNTSWILSFQCLIKVGGYDNSSFLYRTDRFRRYKTKTGFLGIGNYKIIPQKIVTKFNSYYPMEVVRLKLNIRVSAGSGYQSEIHVENEHENSKNHSKKIVEFEFSYFWLTKCISGFGYITFWRGC